MSFIQELYKKRSNYSDPDQATMQENSLEKLSSGIYTEGERFIFELLQNAVDAHNSADYLDVSICIQDGYLVFMHNGDAFTNEDIEGICFVGRKGDKARNAKKIGYKGIGFKSVFGISSKVYIHTGSKCFRFDKDYWRTYWDDNWNSSFGPKPTDLSEYTMPWQVIPIESELPINLDEGNANVATYISMDSENEHKLVESVEGLMKSCRFLIFLKDNNIKMSFTYHSNKLYSIEKRFQNGEVVLYVNGSEESRWMVYQNKEVPLNLTDEQKRRIEKHKSTPDKLKNATSFDLSFAVAIENGKLKKADNAVIYTYLPTSYSFGEGFPFLVNANFITDEGRQHLDVDAEWNKVIVSKIPEEYLKWVATFSKKHSNYYEVLPKKSYGSNNALEDTFASEMVKAINNIAFIPRANDTKSKVLASSAVMDKMGIAEAISKKLLTTHINRTYHKNFSEKDFINPVWKGFKLLEDYGVFIFDKQKLKALFEDEKAFDNIDPCLDVKLIDFLFEYYLQNRSEQEELITVLQDTRFLLDEEGNLSCPHDLFFPSQYKERNDLAEDAIFLHNIVNEHLKSNKQKFSWISQLGVEELSDITFIKNVICKGNYITKENSIEVTRFLFESNLSHNIFDEIDDYYLSRLQFLTKQGNLEYASDLYLGSKYKPEVDIEPYYDGDIFVSDEYCNDNKYIAEWRLFFQKMGANDTIELKRTLINRKECDSYDLLKRAREKFDKLKRFSSNGNPFNCFLKNIDVLYNIYALKSNSWSLQSIIWSKVFSSEKKISNDFARGICDMHYVIHTENDKLSDLVETDFLPWAFAYYQKFPATNRQFYLARELYINTDDIKDIADKYLPVINLNNPIHDSWNEVLHLRNILQLEDYLTILTGISKDEENAEQNKERISKIYQRLVDFDSLTSPVKTLKIKEWSKNNKILSKDGTFKIPKDLRHITLEGFKNYNQVYIGNPQNMDGVLNLLSLMGVKIITEDNVIPTFDGQRINTDISSRLLSTLPALAILAQDCNAQKTYHECKDTLQDKIVNTSFYQCDKIFLAYDDSGDTISKTTFAKDGKFYFTGELRPAKIEPLLQSLCSYLGINGKERELFVIMTEPDFSGIIEYLEDKEYDVTDIKAEMQPMVNSEGSTASVGGQIGGGNDKAAQIADSYEAKTLVLAKLEKKGFDVSEANSDWSVITGVKRNGIVYPLVVKSCKNRNHKLFLNPNEWSQLFKPNSMLWLHFGNSIVAPIKAYELFTYQDKLTLSFDTVNLMMDDRVDKIMEVMRYFNNVHLDMATLNPNQHRAECLEEYLFNSNNPANSDLSVSSID